MSMSCVSVPLRKARFLVDWRLLVQECITYVGTPVERFRFFLFVSMLCFLLKKTLAGGSLQTSLVCIMGELAVGGSVAVGR